MKKKVTLVLSLLLLLSVNLGFVSAHEIFANGSAGAYIIWSNTNLNSSGGPALKVNSVIDSSTTAGGRYAALYQSAMSQWNGLVCGNVTITISYVPLAANPNVYISNSSYVWQDLGSPINVMGITKIYDTSGSEISSYSTAIASTGLIKQCSIYLNPSLSVFKQGGYSDTSTVVTNRIKKTIAHETGHVMLLGHPDRTTYNPISSTVSSLMRQGFPNSTNIPIGPATHEINDIKNKYQYHLTL